MNEKADVMDRSRRKLEGIVQVMEVLEAPLLQHSYSSTLSELQQLLEFMRKVVQVWHAHGYLPPAAAAALFSWSLCWKLESTYVMCQLSLLHRISPQFLPVCKTPQVLPLKSILIAHLVTCTKNFDAW
jgi:hypothetical protein